MADINTVIDAKLVEELKKMNQQLIDAGTNMDKLIPITKQLNDLTNQIAKSTGDNANKKKQLTEAEKESERIKKAIIQTETKINALNDESSKKLTQLRTQLQQNTKSVKDLQRAQLAQKGSTEQLLAVNVILEKRLKGVNQATDEGKRKADLLRSAIDKNNIKIKEQSSALSRQKINIGNYGSALDGVGAKVKRLALQFAGALGLTNAMFIFVNVLKGAFSTIRNFGKENAILAGVLGKTRKEVTQLTNQAIQLGSVYPVTASEVTKLQVSFARLGFVQSEIINLTEATILGSIALNAELDATATLVGAIVKAYRNLGTEDSGAIIDKITLSTQKSSLSFSSLETALPKVAAAASAMNIDLDKTLALLGIAQDATLDASIAGTSLRNIFLELSKSGMTLEESLLMIRGSSNKLKVAYDLFGKRAAIVALALADNIEKAGEFEDAINDAGGTSERVAKEQMATLDGAIKGLGSSWEKTILKFKNSEGFFSNFIKGISGKLDTFTDDFSSRWEKTAALLTPLVGSEKIFGVTSRREERDKVFKFIKENNKHEIALFLERNAEQLKKNKEFNDAVLKAVTDRYNAIDKAESDRWIRLRNEADEAELKRLEDAKKNELQIAANKFGISLDMSKDAIDLEKELSKEIQKIIKSNLEKRKEFNRSIMDEEEDRFNFELELWSDFIKKRSDRIKEAAEEEKRIKKSVADYDKKLREDELAEADKDSERIYNIIKKEQENQQETEDQSKKTKEEQNQATKDEAIRSAAELGNTLFDLKTAGLQREFEAAEGNAEKQAEISKKIAQQEKKKALFNIAVNTATAVVKALPNIPLSIIVGAMGAVQAGVVAATPIPAFATGTDYAPGGLSLVGEKGRELIQTPRGEVFMANNPALINLERGSKVITNRKTEAYLNDGNIVNELRQTRKAIQRMPQSIFKNGSKIAERRGRYWVNYRNDKHRLN